jgi:leader peptidase (prepilin peptidase) / N-methyltransferase
VLQETVLAVYATLVGLVVGSYLNVVIYRLPRGVSTVLPRSRCPWCGAVIRARDNVPLFSFLLLGGRCRQCGAPISWRYPLIEATTGLLFLLSYLRFGAHLESVVAALFCSLMVVLAAIDVDHLILPDRITYPGIAAGLIVQPWVHWGSLRDALLGAALGAGILLALALGWYLVRHEEGMGMGDVKMLAMIGAFLGWKGVVVTLFFGSLSGAVAGVALLAAGKAELRSKLPFGAFLALGGLLALFAAQPIVARYARLL